MTVEFVPSLDRTPLSERSDIGDASRGRRRRRRSRSSCATTPPAQCPRRSMNAMTGDSIEHLRAALAAGAAV